MGLNIIKTSDLRPASFYNGSDRTYLQTSLIVDLLKAGIEQNRVITRNDIVDCYIEWTFRDGRRVVVNEYGSRSGDDWGYYRVEKSKEEFRKMYYTPTRALTWFKSNLGAAILKGKVIAIPIIDVGEKLNSEQTAQECDATKAKK